MEIVETEVKPFQVVASKLRQHKARDGEQEGGWTLDLILQNLDQKPRAKFEFALRYYDDQKQFVGVDLPSWHSGRRIASQASEEFSLYVNPPREATKAELKIVSKRDLPSWVKDPPEWLVYAIFIGAILIGIIWAALS